MISDSYFEIKKYTFSQNSLDNIRDCAYVNGLWPLVYILSDDKIKEAYVGETTDALSRMAAHLKNNSKSRLTAVHLIASDKFNKSATLNIESNLIKYLSGDGQYKLLNANIGLANHSYYQKDLYWEIFKNVWTRLKAEGISKNPIDTINNSDLFKYSPYKSLTPEQKSGLTDIINALCGSEKTVVVEGGAGTGKTILAVYLFKLLHTEMDDLNFREFGEEESEFINQVKKLKALYPKPSMALVIPMASFRETIKKIFRNVKGLSPKMVIGPSEAANTVYDILMVDESHRLRRRVNLGTYFGVFDKVCSKLHLDKNKCTEMDWVIKQSRRNVFFYDHNQTVKPSDVRAGDFRKLLEGESKVIPLKSQFRVKGGNGYVRFVSDLMDAKLADSLEKYSSKTYEFLLFESLAEMRAQIFLKEKQFGLCRLIAGYSWPWISKNNKDCHDIEIDGVKIKWNSVVTDWVNSPGAVEEAGCIHTTQGYDLNYAGIIFGKEISFDKEKNKIVIRQENYFDKNGKQTVKDPEELKTFIINIYKTILLRGIKGTYVYVCDKNLREYFKQHIECYRSQQPTKVLELKSDARKIPFYDVTVAAGNFSDPQAASDVMYIELPEGIVSARDLFVCKVKGESMNKIIPDGSICLFRKYSGGPRDGQIVLAQHQNIQDNDFGVGYTIKKYHSEKWVTEDAWHHKSISLEPMSNNPVYKPIVLVDDAVSELRVIGIFIRVINVKPHN